MHDFVKRVKRNDPVTLLHAILIAYTAVLFIHVVVPTPTPVYNVGYHVTRIPFYGVATARILFEEFWDRVVLPILWRCVDVLEWIGTNILVPILRRFGNVITWLYETIRDIVLWIDRLVGARLRRALLWIWRNIVKPLGVLVQDYFNWIEANIVEPIMRWIVNWILDPVARFIRYILLTLVDWVLRPLWDIFTECCQVIRRIISWCIDNIIVPFFWTPFLNLVWYPLTRLLSFAGRLVRMLWIGCWETMVDVYSAVSGLFQFT